MMTFYPVLQTADTTDFMVLGLLVIIGTILIFIAYLVIRRRNLQRDLEVLETIEAEEN